jgi:HK97 family phage portal protein
MILDQIKSTWNNLTTKSQKAQYSLSAAGNRDDVGQEVPARYSPEIREKIYKTPIVFAALSRIADQVSKVDWELVPKKDLLTEFGYASGEDGKSIFVMTRKDYGRFRTKYTGEDKAKISSKTKQHIEKVYNLFANPNENTESFTSLRKKLALDLKIHDAAALEKTRNGLGEVVELYTAPAPYIRMNYDKNGRLLSPAYIQYDPKLPTTKVATWEKNELAYMMMNPISTSMYGVSPLDVIAQIVATLINALNYNGKYFESAALPEGYFTLPGLTEVQARRLMQKWEQDIKQKHHKVVFMPEGATFHQFRFSNVEMQWLQGQKFYMEIVMAVLGITKIELGFTEDVNRATSDNQSFVFKNGTIIPMLNLIAEKINQEVIGELGFGYDDVSFVFKNVDLADKETMDKIHDRAVKSGRMTINETREEAGYPPYEKMGDKPVIATSQGLVFLEQFDMQFQEYEEEFTFLQDLAKKLNLPMAEVRRRLKSNQMDSEGKPIASQQPQQPKTPPSAPKPAADQTPAVDESKKDANSVLLVEGLQKIADAVDKAINEEN